jgi:Flp pilus assembly protein TadG
MRERLRGERGASAVEFAFIVPLLLSLVLGIAEFGHGFQVQGTLSAAAREGVRVMALQNDPDAARDAVHAATSTFSPALTDAQMDFEPESCPQTGGTQLMTLTVTYPMPLMTGFFGTTVTLTGKAVMRCNG